MKKNLGFLAAIALTLASAQLASASQCGALRLDYTYIDKHEGGPGNVTLYYFDNEAYYDKHEGGPGAVTETFQLEALSKDPVVRSLRASVLKLLVEGERYCVEGKKNQFGSIDFTSVEKE